MPRNSAGMAPWRSRCGVGCTVGPCSLPPNPAGAVERTGLSSDSRRVRNGVRVDVVMACCADDERLASHARHEGRPRGLPRPGFAELPESGDLVDCHGRVLLAQLAAPLEEPLDQLLARGM